MFSVIAVITSAVGPAGRTASATPPCNGVQYSISYAAPVWSVVLLRGPVFHLPAWYRYPVSRDWRPLLERIGTAVGRDEPVTLLDRDENATLSTSDVILLWDEGPEQEWLLLMWSPNVTTQGWEQHVLLRDGGSYRCAGGTPMLLDETFLCLAPLAAIVLLPLLLLAKAVARDRKRREQRDP